MQRRRKKDRAEVAGPPPAARPCALDRLWRRDWKAAVGASVFESETGEQLVAAAATEETGGVITGQRGSIWRHMQVD
ncbi:hypothetical protein EYF80_062499 [Liparis tanakae]|uniref:Uncharacterized protein n=1 Tax=Liparis tanakae TaxID=230148 RepID=A0A4Z2EEP8_9TELE|nr:hypothetical protein EYF80_062499 [Liparis tanakae]